LPAIAAAMTAPYVWFKLLPVSPFGQLSSYHLEITLRHFLASYGAYLDFLFYRDRWFGETPTSVLLAAMLVVALLLKSRHLVFAWSFLVVSFLPIAFVPTRDAYVLYIPLVGWSLYIAVLLVSLRSAILPSRKPIWAGKTLQVALFLLALVLLLRAYRVQRLRMYGELTLGQPVIRSVLAELDRRHTNLPRGARILVINDPLPHPYELPLLLRLYLRDGTLEIDHGSSDDGRHTYVMIWRGTSLHVIDYHLNAPMGLRRVQQTGRRTT